MADTPVASSLELSDEEFMKQSTTLLASVIAEASDGSGHDEKDITTDTTDNSDDQNGDSTDTTDTSADQGTAATAAGDDGQGTADDKSDEDKDDSQSTDTNDEVDTQGKPVTKPAEVKNDKVDKGEKSPKTVPVTKPIPGAVNYQAEYERLLAPFKANGRDIKVENVDEAVRLMQMGANYNRKMAALKPNLAILKMLENNKLLTPEKISFLIDLENKNPEAISKLIKDSGIDPLDISTDKAGNYKPGNHAVNDTQVELDNVLDEISDSPKYAETLDVVAKQWDPKSKQLIANQPNLIKVINGHMENGIYDLVSAELERKKLFGGLNGLSDLEAYREIGDAMAADGKFDAILKKSGQTPKNAPQTAVVKTVVPPNPKKADDSKREEQRRAAAPSKGAAPSTKPLEGINPLGLSDEEFAKFKPTF